MSVNKAIVIGNLGDNPEVRTTEGGTRVATLSLATNRTYENRQGEEVDETQWHRLVLWSGAAEVADEYMSKGDRLYAEGRIEYRQWEGDDGQTRYTTEIVVRDFEMLGGSSGGGRSGPPPRGEDEKPSRDDKQVEGAKAGGGGEDWDGGDLDDDLPF